METHNQNVHLSLLQEKNVSLTIKREDLIHPFVSGNKFRKLKYNILTAKNIGFKTILTYGGAFSNHIAATAYAGKQAGFKTIGVVRGEEIEDKWHDNHTLKLANENGMRFHFVSRDAYRKKENPSEIEKLANQFGAFYRLPEGGSNTLAVKGCEEILVEADYQFDVVCVAIGTGGTVAGISNAAHRQQRVLGFPALKGDSSAAALQVLTEDIRKFASKENWELQTDYHFGGYAKTTAELIRFMNGFKQETGILLDPIYTGKMLFGILDMVKKDRFEPHTKILAIHTGGLQSITGMNQKLKRKNLPLIQL